MCPKRRTYSERMRRKILSGLIVVLLITGCGVGKQSEDFRKLEDRVTALETRATASTVNGEVTEVTSQPPVDEPEEVVDGGPRACGEGGRCPGTPLAEFWATRGIRTLAPVHWEADLSDAGGSGAEAEWWNPKDPEERIKVYTGVSKGMWYEIDGEEGSISPGLMISETADVYPVSPTVFQYVDSEDDIAILGVFRVFPNDDPCCYYQADVRLRYDHATNAHFWNMFLEHQLLVVADTDSYLEFQHHMLADRFS